METALILAGIGCVIGAIAGTGFKINSVIEVGAVGSLWRQGLLAIFGALLITLGLAIGGHIQSPAALLRQGAIAKDASASPRSGPVDSKPAKATTDGLSSPPQNIRPENPVAASARIQSICKKYAGMAAGEWTSKFLLPASPQKYHIFVQTLEPTASEAEADQAAQSWNARFANKGVEFRVMSTEGLSGGNDRYTVVVGQGLDRETAQSLTTYIRSCGVERGAYAYQQDVGRANF